MARPLLPIILTVGLLAGCRSPMATQRRSEGLVRGPDRHVLFASESEMPWRQGPASLPPGARFAVLEGDLETEGVLTMRLQFPDGYQIPPHWHPNFERVTVLRGVAHLGTGETFDRDAAKRLPAGAYTTMPPGMRHYVYVEGETVIQITTIGPWKIHYVNPTDDPRRER